MLGLGSADFNRVFRTLSRVLNERAGRVISIPAARIGARVTFARRRVSTIGSARVFCAQIGRRMCY
jgi:hypothetical protein